MEHFDKAAFFNDIVQKLHNDGVLKSYDEPKGIAHPEWEAGSKKAHNDPRKNVPGTIWHVGDEPYSILTTQELSHFKDLGLDQRDISMKSTSIRAAINAYIPKDKFADYLEYFRTHLDDSGIQFSVRGSLREMYGQLNKHQSYTRSEYDALLSDGTGNDWVRSATATSKIHWTAENYPELVLSMAIYHAAHQCYISELYKAIQQHPDLNEDERENGIFTLSTRSFSQFHFFLLFQSMLPLTIHAYEKDHPTLQNPDAPLPQVNAETGAVIFKQKVEPQPVDHDRMRKAIGEAWGVMFDHDFLTRHYSEAGSTPKRDGSEPTVAQQTCPAKGHLQAAMKQQTLEGMYDYVVANSKADGIETLLYDAKYEAAKLSSGYVGTTV